MALIHLNPVVIETFARLLGASEFLETISEGIPTVEEKEHRYLEQLATQGSWDAAEYFGEKDSLDMKFRTWIPTFAAYSVIILLYSIIETQLFAFAEHLGKKRGSKLRVKDMAGQGVERSAIYLELVLSLLVKTDPAWCRIQDLQSLRNIIVHRGGKAGESQEQQRTVEELIKKYPQAIQLRKADGFHEQMWISINLCRDFAQNIDGFFERIFKAAGLPNRSGQLDS